MRRGGGITVTAMRSEGMKVVEEGRENGCMIRAEVGRERKERVGGGTGMREGGGEVTGVVLEGEGVGEEEGVALMREWTGGTGAQDILMRPGSMTEKESAVEAGRGWLSGGMTVL